jgi:hypothetical protein
MRSVELRFWSKVRRGEPDECWPWTGEIDRGYGRFYTTGREHKHAHRLAYEFSARPIPAGLHVLHSCDNRPCCNPAHLRVGTNEENVRDRVSRERSACKLSVDKVARMRKIYRRGGLTQADIGSMFGVSQSTANRALRGDCWRRVETPAIRVYSKPGAERPCKSSRSRSL